MYMNSGLNIKYYTRSDDTIAAISTPPGEGGIGIVRLSGPDSFHLADKIFVPVHKGSNYPRSHRLYYGYIQGEDQDTVDEVLVSFMRSPKTYTREDIVEINCHSGPVVLKMILNLVIDEGARLADPGEFTRRAFINGRIDLSQAESVMNLIQASSDKAVRSAARIIQGKLSRELADIRSRLFENRVYLEALVDFPEDDVETVDYKSLKEQMDGLYRNLERLYQGAQKGVIFQEGLKISLVGKVNVGKSSLLNNLLQNQRAIVTEIPGTTRDTLEEVLNLGGVPFRIVDTAGIRKSDDPVEKLGIERALNAVEESDLVLLMLDGVTGIENEDKYIMQRLQNEKKETLVVINKTDLDNRISKGEIKSLMPGSEVFKISAVKGSGINILEDYLGKRVNQISPPDADHLLVLSQRHRDALEKAKDILHRARVILSESGSLDLISWELQQAEEKLGEITGDTINQDVLEHIFNNFCIGK